MMKQFKTVALDIGIQTLRTAKNRWVMHVPQNNKINFIVQHKRVVGLRQRNRNPVELNM